MRTLHDAQFAIRNLTRSDSVSALRCAAVRSNDDGNGGSADECRCGRGRLLARTTGRAGGPGPGPSGAVGPCEGFGRDEAIDQALSSVSFQLSVFSSRGSIDLNLNGQLPTDNCRRAHCSETPHASSGLTMVRPMRLG